MKTFLGSIAAAFSLAIGAFATDITVPSDTPVTSIPVGNEGYFRAEGAKQVNEVSSFIHMVTAGAINPTGFGWHYEVRGSEAELLAAGKETARSHLLSIADIFEEYPTNIYRLRVGWKAGEYGTLLSYVGPFRYYAEFSLVQGTDGKWQAPAWVVGSMKMDFGDYVLLPFPGATEMRIRWFEDGEFKNFSYPNPAEFGLQSAQSVKKPLGLGGEEIFALPVNPLTKKLLGVLTVKGSWGEETILRYSTSTGTMFPGLQGEREPLMVGLRQVWFGVRILPSGDYDDISKLAFERSKDLHVWREIVEDGVSAGIANGGMGVVPEGIEFFRARYR